MLTQKGFLSTSIIVIVGIIVILGGIYFLSTQMSSFLRPTSSPVSNSQNSPKTQTSQNATEAEKSQPLPSIEPLVNSLPVNKIALLKDKGVVLINPDGTGLNQIYNSPEGSTSNMVWSPNGKYLIAYDSLSLVLIDINSKKSEVLVSSAGLHSLPAWSPDSRHIVYNANGTLKIMNIQTKAITEIANDAFTFNSAPPDYSYHPPLPIWTTKNQIFYLQKAVGNVAAGEKRLAVISSDGSKKILVPDKDIHIYDALAVSLDGTKVAYSENDKGFVASKGIWIINSDGTNDRLLTKEPVISANFRWSADGTYLLGTGGLGGMTYINTQTGESNSIPTSGVTGGWSPDSKQIVYITQTPNVEKGGEIHIYNLTTRSSKRISEAFSSFWGHTWSPL